MVQSKATSSLLFKSLLGEIHALHNSSALAFSIHHIYREANAGLVVETFSSSFPYLCILIQNDFSGISYPRFIS